MKVVRGQCGIPDQSVLATIQEDPNAVLGRGVALPGELHESLQRLSVSAHELAIFDIGSGVLVAPRQETREASQTLYCMSIFSCDCME